MEISDLTASRIDKNDKAEQALTLSTADVQPILRRHQGCKIFAEVLEQVQDDRMFLCVLSQFIEFNSVFGCGVATLAAELSFNKHLFQDPNENIALIADRSCDVAAPIYYAAVDEFGRNTTHRAMAQNTLRTTAQYLNLLSEEANSLTSSTPETTRAIEKVHRGYCRASGLAACDLFCGIGFHVGSEILASQEFAVLDAYLRRVRPELVRHLTSADSYAWIAIHPHAEEDHFAQSLEAATRALRYCAHQRSAKAWIRKGIDRFATVQEEFMSSLKQLIVRANS